MKRYINRLLKAKEAGPAVLLWGGASATVVFFVLVYLAVGNAYGTLERAESDSSQATKTLAEIHRAGASFDELTLAAAASSDSEALREFEQAGRRLDSVLVKAVNDSRSRPFAAALDTLRSAYARISVIHRAAVARGQSGDAAGALALLGNCRHEMVQWQLLRASESATRAAKSDEKAAYGHFRVQFIVAAFVLSLLLVLLATAWLSVIRALRRQQIRRRVAEGALAASEAKCRTLLDDLPQALFIVQDGKIAFCNPAAVAALGYRSGQEVVGVHSDSIIVPPRQQSKEERGHGNSPGEVPDHFITDLKRCDEEHLPVEVFLRSVVFDERDAVQVLAVDISERMHAEMRLRESEERFRNMADTAPVLIWMAGPKRHTFYFNKTWLNFRGRTLAQEYGLGWIEGIHPDDVERCCETYDHAFSVRRSFSLEFRLRHADGSWRWLLDCGVPRVTPDGNFAGFIGSCVDITDRRCVEEALRESEDTFRSFNEAAFEGIGFTENDRILVVNHQLARMFGYRPEDLIGHYAMDLVMPDDRHLVDERSARKDTDPYEHRAVRKDGTIFDVEVRARSVSYKGRPARLTVIRDVTERKTAEEERAAHAAELERSNAELERFAYVASHDLQEPLRTMAGYADLLEKRYKAQLDEDARDFIRYIADGAERMQRLIRDLLAFSRLETRAKNFGDTSCESALRQAVNNLQLTIDESGAVITHSSLPVITGDDVQMVQLFQNLVGNAVKFRGSENPCVHISAAEQNGDWVFAVEDNGIGIDPQYFEKIFVIFKRLHSGADYPGTGIGLALCKKIVERHGGHIWVESEPGHGTRFLFTLPRPVTDREATRS